MARYSKKAQDTVEDAMHRFKKGTLKSGSGDKVKSRKQAIAIGISEAREKGAKVPSRKSSAKKKTTASKKTSAKSTRKRSSSTARKKSAK